MSTKTPARPRATRTAPPWRRLAAAVIALATVITTVGIAAPAAAAGTAVVSAAKTADRSEAAIGAGLITFTIGVDECFNITGGCDGVVLSDVLPPGLEYVAMQSGPAPSVATVDEPSAANGNTLTIAFVNPLGSGDTVEFTYTARIVADGSVQPGDVLTNALTVSAANADLTDTVTASVTATLDPIGDASVTKNWTPSTLISQLSTGEATTMTVSATNTGNRSADRLTLVEPTAGDPFQVVDATGASGTLPTGATGASLTVRLDGGATASVPVVITGSSWVVDPAATVDWPNVVGVEVEYVGAITGTNELAAPSVSPGTLVVDSVLRAERRDGSPLVAPDAPNAGIITNTASVVVAHPGDELEPVERTASKDLTILFPAVDVDVTKSNYAPASLVRNATTPVSATITATNRSVGGAATMTITDAPDGETDGNPFLADELDLTSLDIVLPAGAISATIRVVHDSGPDSVATVTSDQTGWTGGFDLSTAVRFEVVFEAASGEFIASDAIGSVVAHSVVNWSAVPAGAQPRGNVAQAEVVSGVTEIAVSSAIEQTPRTNPLGVTDPVYAISVAKRYSGGIGVYYPTAGDGARGGTTIRLDGEVGAASTPMTTIVLQEPSAEILTGPAESNPLNFMDLTAVSGITVPADTTLTLWYFDADDTTGGPAGDGWKPIAGGSFAAGTDVDFDLPAAVRESGMGIRFVFERTAGVFTAGNTVTGSVRTEFRALTDPRVAGTAFPAAETDEQGNRRWELPRNCAVATGTGTIGATTPDATDVTTGAECPTFTLLEPTGSSWVAKRVPWNTVREQAPGTTTPTSLVDGRVVLSLESGVYRPDATAVAITEPGTGVSNAWLRAFDLVRLGGPTVRPGASSGTETIPAVRLFDGEQAVVQWRDLTGATVASTTVAGAGSRGTDAGVEFVVDVAAATGAVYPQVAGFVVTFSRTDGAALDDGFFQWAGSAGSQGRGIVIATSFDVRAYERTEAAGPDGNHTADGDGLVANPGGTAPSAAANFLPVRDERSYGFDANATGTVDCTEAFGSPVTVPSHATPLGDADADCGWLSNDVRVDVDFLPITDPASPWYAQSQEGIDHHSELSSNFDRRVQITPATVDITGATSAAIAAPAASGNMGVPESGTPAVLFPTASYSSTATVLGDTAVSGLSVTVGASSAGTADDPAVAGLPERTLTPYTTADGRMLSALRVTDLTITATGTGITGLRATIVKAGSASPVVVTAATAADLRAAIIAAGLADVVGIQVAALGTAIATSATVRVDLALQLRTHELLPGGADGAEMIDTLGGGDQRVVCAPSDGAVLDVVANDHVAGNACITLERGAPGLSTRKAITPGTGNVDQNPAITVELTAGNTGTTAVESLRLLDLDDADGAGPEVSDFFDRFDVTAITTVRAPFAIDPSTTTRQPVADVATVILHTGIGAPTAGTPIVLGSVDATTGEFDLAPLAGVDWTTVRGIEVVFERDAGSIPQSTLTADAALVVFTAKGRSTLASDPSTKVAAGSVTNALVAEAAVGDVGPITRPAEAVFAFQPGTAQVGIDKLIKAPSGDYLPASQLVSTGDVIDYAIVLENTGTADVIPSIEDHAPAQLSPTVSVNDGVDYRAPGSTTWVPLATAFPAVVPVYAYDPATRIATWTFPGLELDPGTGGGTGAAIRVRTAYQVLAGGLGDVSNVAVATGVPESGCLPADWTGPNCDSAATVQVNARGGFVIEKFSQGIPGENVRQADGVTGPCAVDSGFTRYPCAVTIGAGGEYDYRVQVTNHGAVAATGLVIADRLPTALGTGDTALTQTGPAGLRGSEWVGVVAATPVLERVAPLGGATSVIPASAVTMQYTTSASPCAADVTTAPDACAAGEWTTFDASTPIGDLAAATGLQFVLDLSGAAMQPGESVRVTWSMTAPADSLTWSADTTDFQGQAAADRELTQWNTAAYRAVIAGGQQRAGESSKAGVRLAIGELRIEKVLQNDTIAPDDALGPFQLDFTCSVDAGDPIVGTVFAIVGADGSIGYAPTASGPVVEGANRFVLPAGADCVVTESVDGGADEATVVPGAVTIEASEVTTVTATNRFAPHSLSVTKSAIGDAPVDATVFGITVTCELDGVALELPDADAAFDLEPGTSHVIAGLPGGAECLVSEPDNQGALTTTIDGTVLADGETGVTVTVDATATTVLVENNYGDTGLNIVKTVDSTLADDIVIGPFVITATCQVPGEDAPRIRDFDFTSAGGALVWTGLPAGTECSVEETTTGFAHEVEVDDTDATTGGTLVDGVVELGIGESETVEVTNRYLDASLTLTKSVEGATAEEVWSFTAICEWAGGTVERDAELAADGTVTFTGLPLGSECVITEGATSADETVWSLDGDVVEPVEGGVEVVLDESTLGDDGTVEIAALNRYLAELLITKTVAGPAQAGEVYEVTLTPVGGGEPIVIAIAAGETVTVDGLLAGSVYTVVETRTGGADTVAYAGLTGGAIELAQGENGVGVKNTFVALQGTGMVLGPLPQVGAALAGLGLLLLLGAAWRRRRSRA